MDNNLFTRIEPHSMGSEILYRMREAIISGQIKLGGHINESDIAKQMEISRIPVREALRKLEQEGLVVRKTNKGCFVTTFTEQDVKEVFSLRATLECMAFEWAIPEMTPQDVQELKDQIEQQKQAIFNKDYDELTHLDMHFHEYICRKANHSRLLKAWYEQNAQCQMLLNLLYRHLGEFTPDTINVEHGQLIEAIENNDSKRAIAITCKVSKRVSHECIQALQSVEKLR